MSQTIGTKNPLEHSNFSVPPLHIPDGKGGAFKTELVLARSKERVEKIQWWFGPDPRREPHNHPWKDQDGVSFKSTILFGGYTETKYWFEDGYLKSQVCQFRQGDINEVLYNVFHTVDQVEPGTVTRMVTGPVFETGDWGYLIEGKYVSAKDDPYPNKEFFEQLCEINPHKRMR